MGLPLRKRLVGLTLDDLDLNPRIKMIKIQVL